MKIRQGLLALCVLALLTGCSATTAQTQPKLPDTAVGAETADMGLARQFVEKYGYEVIVAHKEPLHSFVLEKELLREMPYQQIWSVQEKEPDPFIGKAFTIYTFTVDNHPLENTYDFDTNVYVMVAEGEVVGGYSFPDSDELLYGGVYAIDGRTMEDVKGLTYPEWIDQWTRKYGELK